jgi:phage terminase large subunit-like protein
VINDPTFFARIYAAPDDADWTDEAVWRAANPALADFRSLEEMRTLCEQAKVQPALQNTFRRLYLNQWTSSETRWIDPNTWQASAGVVDRGLLAGRECYAGLDLSSTTDLTALVLVFPMDDGAVQVLPFFWIPEATARRAEVRDRVPYTTWAAQGLVTLTPGDAVDYGFIETTIKSLAREFQIRELAYDRWQASYLVQRLMDDGLTCIPVGMGYASMSAPMKHLEALVRQRRLHHGGHPVLAWQADNLMVEQDAAGNIKPSKAKSRQRIDGMVALVMALGRLIVQPQVQNPYLERGLVIL